MPDIQSELISGIQSLCRDLGERHHQNLHQDQAFKAAQVLLGRNYRPRVRLPKSAKAIWSKREGRDHDLTPLEFYKKYWERYAEILTQRDFRQLDRSLFEAIRFYCRQNHLDAKDFLPPPAREKSTTKQKQTSRPISQRRTQHTGLHRAA
jgi:hypothetical protein